VVPAVKESGGYIFFSSDHSVALPPSSLEDFRRITDLAKELGSVIADGKHLRQAE